MYDKLSIINTALTRTGNNTVNFEEDGSSEWQVGSDAYETEIDFLLSDHDWGFATDVAVLQRQGSSQDPRFTDAYFRPAGSLQLLNVYITYGTQPVSLDYSIQKNLICCSPVGVSVAPTCKFMMKPSNDQWNAHFIEALRCRVMAHVYRGLNEDTTEADKMMVLSENFLQKAKARSDQETPPRAYFVGSLKRARRTRRGGIATAYNVIAGR